MKTIFDKATRDDLIGRINQLDENSKPGWGKMNTYQMLKHCVLAEEMYLGKKVYGRTLLGLIIGTMALKSMLKDEAPMGRNAPTKADFIVTEVSGDVSLQKKEWIALLGEYAHFSEPGIVHWFFGPMTREQVGYFVYKHTDHHLRQFNV